MDRKKIREAAEWPTMKEIAEMYNVPERFVRMLWDERLVEAVRLNTIRLNPKSVEAYIESQYSPGA